MFWTSKICVSESGQNPAGHQRFVSENLDKIQLDIKDLCLGIWTRSSWTSKIFVWESG